MLLTKGDDMYCEESEDVLRSRYETLLAEVVQQGYIVHIVHDESNFTRYYAKVSSELPLASCRKHDNSNYIDILINEVLQNEDKDVYYATLGHELGHAFDASSNEMEIKHMNMLRALGDQRATDIEIQADTYGCAISKEGMKKLLTQYLDYDIKTKNNFSAKEITQRLEAIDKR